VIFETDATLDVFQVAHLAEHVVAAVSDEGDVLLHPRLLVQLLVDRLNPGLTDPLSRAGFPSHSSSYDCPGIQKPVTKLVAEKASNGVALPPFLVLQRLRV